MELDYNIIFKSAQRSKMKFYKIFVHWLGRHYFGCDIHPNDNICNSVSFAHNALGIVINANAIVQDDVIIQHHVTIGSNDRGGGGSKNQKRGIYRCSCYCPGRHRYRRKSKNRCRLCRYKRCAAGMYGGRESHENY